MKAGRIIARRYRIVRELGRGGMGVVYVVEHVHTGERLALKMLSGQGARDPGALERFKREARVAALIRSENVVRVVDADVAHEEDGGAFLVMDLLEGTDLDQHLRARGALTAREVLAVMRETARALDRAHEAGVVHRDLKPANLFIHRREDGTSTVKILDFGISKMVGDAFGGDIAAAAMTQTGTLMGTPLYMSPEQACGRVSDIGPPTDVWAIGLIVLQLLTGEGYWRANTVAELMANIIAQPMDRPTSRWPWLPAAMDAWFARSCARSVAERFRSVGEQIDALARALRDVAAASAPALESVTSPGDAQRTLDAPLGECTGALEREALGTVTHRAASTTSPAALPVSARAASRRKAWVIAVSLVASVAGAYVWAGHSGPGPSTSRSGSLGSQSTTGTASAAHPFADGGDSFSGAIATAYETERPRAMASFDLDAAMMPVSTGMSGSIDASSSRPAVATPTRRRAAAYAPLAP